ncbi:MAG TPA: hypothetical protein VK968_07375, partial [Roseimicrobium sp.]|nr:hypothetical protein [Roseimicrobium sp.]
NRTDIDGVSHKLRNNVGYKGRTELTRFDAAQSDASSNSFDLQLRLTDKDFAGLNEEQLLLPRNADGSLPTVDFMRPSDDSQLIDKGAAIGFPFKGAAPDLGAFEHK